MQLRGIPQLQNHQHHQVTDDPNSNLYNPQFSYFSNPPPHLPSATDAHLQPPGIDSSAPHLYLPHTSYDATAAAATYVYTAPIPPPQFTTDTSSLTAKDAARQFGADLIAYVPVMHSYATEQMVAAIPNPLYGSSAVPQFATGTGSMYKYPKKTKVARPVRCQICNIDCNSNDVYVKHIQGKKHRKIVQKLTEPVKEENATKIASSTPGTCEKATPLSQGTTVAGQAAKKVGAPRAEAGDNLETKRRKLMEGGASADSVRVCIICNVACNSETVYRFHMEGQKHAAQLRKRSSLAMAMAAAATAGQKYVPAT